jgi:glycosyltransferase involved in cell wall biosynthesis
MPEPAVRPPIAEAPVSVVLPAYNAAASVEPTLRGWAAYLDGLAREYEILLVDDGSTDQTRERAEALQLPRLRVLHHDVVQGQGAALRTGLVAARLPLICYCECSAAYQPADLSKMLELIDQVDVVTGYRPLAVRPHRSRAERIHQWLVRLIFGLHLKDVDCPFKLFRRAVFDRIPIQSDGPFVHAEILAKANFLTCLIAEVEVTYQPSAAVQAVPGSLRLLRKEAVRVFRRPDFGPAVLPTDDLPPAEGSA